MKVLVPLGYTPAQPVGDYWRDIVNNNIMLCNFMPEMVCLFSTTRKGLPTSNFRTA